MILSHRHRFIFIKTRKTAGTSIEASLSRYCGPDDIITPVTLEDEWFRGQFGLGPQNFRNDAAADDRSPQGRPLRSMALRAVSRIELRRPGTVPYRIRRSVVNDRGAPAAQAKGFYNHMPLSEVLQHVGEDVVNSYFKFTFERNPFDKVASDYWYRASDRSLDDYLRDGPLPADFDKYAIDDRIAVDFVGRFENIQADLAHALRQVGLEFDGWLPRAKTRTRRSGVSAADLNEQQRDRIRTVFAREFDAFGYARDAAAETRT
ncbi:MAG: hypothetical protein V2I24_17125 [Halieaceae bacterium]|jgi:hypothetical protein|nr:hypothetical protein [Halieaceae bacterium]